jgi:hypothetical protein
VDASVIARAAAAAPLDAARRGGARAFSMSRAVEERFGPIARDRALAERRKTVTQAIAAKLARVRRAQERSSEDLAKAEGADSLRAHAELLKPMLSRIPRGATQASCTDWSSGEAVGSCAAAPGASAKQNLEALRPLPAPQRRAARRRRAQRCRRRRRRWSRWRRRRGVEGSSTARAHSAGSAAGLDRRATRRRNALPHVQDAAGRPVGREIRDAERSLTFGVAKGTDLWLHARGATGPVSCRCPARRAGARRCWTRLTSRCTTRSAASVADVQHCRIRMLRRVAARPGANR